jgi:hypothetical protein
MTDINTEVLEGVKNLIAKVEQNNALVEDFLRKYELKQLASPEQVCLTRIMNTGELPRKLYWSIVKTDPVGRKLFRKAKFFDHIDKIAAENGWVEQPTKLADRTWFATQGDYEIFVNSKRATNSQDLESIAKAFLGDVESTGYGNLSGWVNEKLHWPDNDVRFHNLDVIANDLTLTDEWIGSVRRDRSGLYKQAEVGS